VKGTFFMSSCEPRGGEEEPAHLSQERKEGSPKQSSKSLLRASGGGGRLPALRTRNPSGVGKGTPYKPLQFVSGREGRNDSLFAKRKIKALSFGGEGKKGKKKQLFSEHPLLLRGRGEGNILSEGKKHRSSFGSL